MQKIQIHLRLDGVIGQPVDSYGQSARGLASITRGMQAELELRLLDTDGEDYVLPEYAAWDFVLAHDWDTATPPQLRVSEGITTDGNVVSIPLENINTLELIAQLGKNESVTLGAELCGFSAGVPTPDFVCQFSLVVRNRRSDAGTGSPEPVGDGSYSAAQVDALLAELRSQIEDLQATLAGMTQGD